MDPKVLAKSFRANMMAEGQGLPKEFADALRALSDYILTEQFLVRKDNNSNIKRNETSSEARGYDIYGNPRPLRSENIIKYHFDKEDYKTIMEFFKKIKFNKIPIIGKGKRTVVVFDDKRSVQYSSDTSHVMNMKFENGEPYCVDVIYVIDKIKDLLMHTNYRGTTNFRFDPSTGFSKVYLKQTGKVLQEDGTRIVDFELDCEINIEDILTFCESIKNKYYEKVYTYPSEYVIDRMMTIPLGQDLEYGYYDDLGYLTYIYEKYQQEDLRDFYTYSYLSLLSYETKTYPVLFDEKVDGLLEWYALNEEYVAKVEKILDGIMTLFIEATNQNRLTRDKLLCRQTDNNGNVIYSGLIFNIAQYNKLIVELLRHSRAHMHLYNLTEDEYILFTNSLRNSSVNKSSVNDNPNFKMYGYIDGFKQLFDNITFENITLDVLYDDIQNKDFSDALVIWFTQLKQLLFNFSRFTEELSNQIEDKDLLNRYLEAGKKARIFINQGALDCIQTKLYASFSRGKNK